MASINFINGHILDPEYQRSFPDNHDAAHASTDYRVIKKRHPSIKLIFQSLCPTVHTVINLTDDDEYRYHPAIYQEIRCAHPQDQNHQNKVCSKQRNSACIQQYTTIYLTKQRYGSNCGEPETRRIPSGCECMIPVPN